MQPDIFFTTEFLYVYHFMIWFSNWNWVLGSGNVYLSVCFYFNFRFVNFNIFLLNTFYHFCEFGKKLFHVFKILILSALFRTLNLWGSLKTEWIILFGIQTIYVFFSRYKLEQDYIKKNYHLRQYYESTFQSWHQDCIIGTLLQWKNKSYPQVHRRHFRRTIFKCKLLLFL